MHKCLLFGFWCCVLLLLQSCRTTSTVTESIDHTDSLVTVRYVERTVHDTIEVQLPIEVRSVVVANDTSCIATTVAKSFAWTDSLGMLHHTIENLRNTLPVVIDKVEVTKDSIVYRDRNVYIETTKKTSNRIPWVLMLLGFIIGILTSALLLYLSRKSH